MVPPHPFAGGPRRRLFPRGSHPSFVSFACCLCCCCLARRSMSMRALYSDSPHHIRTVGGGKVGTDGRRGRGKAGSGSLPSPTPHFSGPSGPPRPSGPSNPPGPSGPSNPPCPPAAPSELACLPAFLRAQHKELDRSTRSTRATASLAQRRRHPTSPQSVRPVPAAGVPCSAPPVLAPCPLRPPPPSPARPLLQQQGAARGRGARKPAPRPTAPHRGGERLAQRARRKNRRRTRKEREGRLMRGEERRIHVPVTEAPSS